jgi:hypothetical protein
MPAKTIIATVTAAALVSAGTTAGAHTLKPYKASCINRSFTAFVLVVRPARCIMASSPSAPFARAANLAGLRWRTWRGTRAIATGYELSFHRPLAHIPATVVLTRPAFVEELGIYVCKHFRVTTRYGTLSGTINAG